ncbi:MAG: pyruvate ferredoxin oxidoreductase [Gemmatimonadota bacterium]|nr:MAG: pyruvate ferredoxin oxidoreductase [Gemmatimonadota bacterium]
MRKIVALTGNDAVGTAMKQINPDVVAAFPITPQTELMHKFAEFHANGEVDTELVLVESEHSAMSACVGAAAAGARTMTATSAQGLALMWEILYVQASCRLPMVMPVVNRALNAPLNIHCDHSDTMGARDCGWIQIYSENTQEAYDNVIQGVPIGEKNDVRLPVMITLDGFILSHTMERVELLDDDEIQRFIGEYQHPHSLLDTENPVTYGPVDLPDYYFEHKRQQVLAMERAKDSILEVGRAFADLTGRDYGLFEEYRLGDAEIAILAMGSTAGTAKEAVDQLRDRGKKVGLLKLRVFRPFPYEELGQSLEHLKVLAIFDRAISFGSYGGALFSEVRSALFGAGRIPLVTNYIYGLGGRNISVEEIGSVFDELEHVAQTQQIENTITYLGVRE